MTAHFGHRGAMPKPIGSVERRLGESTAGGTAEAPVPSFGNAPELRPAMPSAPATDKAHARAPANAPDLHHTREIIRDLVLSRLDPVAATRSNASDLEVALRQM